MAVPYMTTNPVPVTTSQPLTPWVRAKGARIVKFILYCDDPTNTGHIIPEACEEIDDSGNAIKGELLEPVGDVQCPPGQEKSYVLKNCPYNYVRLSASGDSPSFPSTMVRGGLEVLQ